MKQKMQVRKYLYKTGMFQSIIFIIIGLDKSTYDKLLS